MKKSATQLGAEFCLNGEEMNYIFKEQGYLDGEPGDYTPTPKGMSFAEETHYHRGTGGYAMYNRDWTTRRWDDSILNELDLSEEVINEARTAVSERKRQQRAELKAASEAYWAKHSPMVTESNDNGDFSEENTSNSDKAYAVLGVLFLAGAGVKLACNLWREKIAPKIEVKTRKQKKNCPRCTNAMRYERKQACWICKNCSFIETDIETVEVK